MAKDIDWSKSYYSWEEADEWEYEDFEDDSPWESWPNKRENPTSGYSTLHVIDLNKIKDGATRRLYAVYGVPVGWGSNDAELEEFEEHYEWIRERIEGSEKAGWSQTQALADQANAQRIGMQQAAASADPGLLAPFEGVTVQIWAQPAVALKNTPDEAGQARALAGLGMDRAKWDRVNDEYQSRM